MTLIYWVYDEKLYLFYCICRKGTLYLKHMGVNGRNTSNGYSENQLYGPNDKRGNYPIINGF